MGSKIPPFQSKTAVSFQTTTYFLIHPHLKSKTVFSLFSSLLWKAWWFLTVLSPNPLVFSCKNYQSTAIQINSSLSFLQCHFNLYILFSVQCYIFFILWDTAQQWVRFQLTFQIYSRLQLERLVKVISDIFKDRFTALLPIKSTMSSWYWHESSQHSPTNHSGKEQESYSLN